ARLGARHCQQAEQAPLYIITLRRAELTRPGARHCEQTEQAPLYIIALRRAELARLGARHCEQAEQAPLYGLSFHSIKSPVDDIHGHHQCGSSSLRATNPRRKGLAPM